MLFGGLGQNFMNPALGARCFLLIAFAADMTNFATAWKATLEELCQQQIDYSEGIRTIYSEFLNFGQNLIGSTQTVTERLRDLVKNLVNDILNMMMKIYMQQIMIL